MLSLEALKNKYRSVIQEAQAQGVQISEMKAEDGKLIITGIAPSLEAANNVWNEIKRVNPSLYDDDIRANFSVTPSYGRSIRPSREKPTGPGNSSNAVQTYTVQPGDTLTSISKHFYGNMRDYKRILNANRGKIGNKDLIRVGQELSIP